MSNSNNKKKREPQLKKGNYIVTIVGENGKIIKRVLALGSEIFVDTIANAEGLVVDI